MGDVVFPLVLSELNLLPELKTKTSDILITVFDESSALFSLKLASQLRENQFNVEVYPEPVKIGKQFKYADRSGIRFVVVAGPDEISNGQIQLKDLKTGMQEAFTTDLLLSKLDEWNTMR